MKRGEEKLKLLFNLALDRLNDPKNVSKGGWETDDKTIAWDRFYDEVLELENELFMGPLGDCCGNRVKEEAGDVVASLMILLDVVGLLTTTGEDDANL